MRETERQRQTWEEVEYMSGRIRAKMVGESGGQMRKSCSAGAMGGER